MINHNNFINFAEFLLSSDDDISIRTATSRAYYGMYHFAMNLVDNKVPIYDQKTVRGGVHERLTYYLTHEAAEAEDLDPAKLQKIAIKLKIAKRHRVVADYKLNLGLSKITAAETVMEAKAMAETFSY
ncbi:hypothetical protein PZA22_14465 [Pectobacterium polaris]|uniref:hypothetical protein n=1 Tax=Pectobacterium polaris TaxID=2042057 RepID=UPI0023B02ACB|nr:hypothetical protein [Pectobacterium polaris]MDE8755684.1 hypothetical protein [Pectobacterium polaris]